MELQAHESLSLQNCVIDSTNVIVPHVSVYALGLSNAFVQTCLWKLDYNECDVVDVLVLPSSKKSDSGRQSLLGMTDLLLIIKTTQYIFCKHHNKAFFFAGFQPPVEDDIVTIL